MEISTPVIIIAHAFCWSSPSLGFEAAKRRIRAPIIENSLNGIRAPQKMPKQDEIEIRLGSIDRPNITAMPQT